MALPIKPLGPVPEAAKETVPDEPEFKAPTGLNLPDNVPSSPESDEFRNKSFRGISLDAEEESREEALAAQRAEFGEARLSNGLNKNDFQMIGGLTSDDLINQTWAFYSALQPKIVEVKTWLQEVLAEQGKTADIGEARYKRGAKYKEMNALLDTLLVRHFAQESIIQSNDAGTLMNMVKNEMLGLGPIEPLWMDPRISEIMVNGPYDIYVEIKGKLLKVPGARFRDQTHLLDVCQQILSPLNKTIDSSHTTADGRLSDGSRVNITHPDVGPAGPFLTIRRFPETIFTFKTMVDNKAMSNEIAEEVGNLVHIGLSTVVVGGTGSGKTSTLNALSGCIPNGERIITIEDNLELRLHPDRHVIAMEGRTGQHGKEGAVTIRDLVRNSLRQRPDRIVVGEVRDGSAYDMLQAMNTGHDGSMTTVHANDAFGAVERLVNLISEVGEIDSNRALSLIAGGVDLIVTIERYEDGSRRTSGVYEIPNRVTAKDGVVTLDPIPLYEFVQDGLDDKDKIYGHYEKLNDLSDSMVRKHRIDRRPRLSLEELYNFTEYQSY